MRRIKEENLDKNGASFSLLRDGVAMGFRCAIVSVSLVN